MNYYVYNPKGSKPRKIHATYSQAIEEAGRIALAEQTEVFVLGIMSKVTPPEREYFVTELTTIPLEELLK